MNIEPEKFIVFIGLAYRMFVRAIIKHAIDDPSTEWDNTVLDLLDSIFGYQQTEEDRGYRKD